MGVWLKTVLIFLLIIPIVLADDIKLNQGETVILSGRSLKLENVGEFKVILVVDGVTKILALDESEEVSGLVIRLIEIEEWGNDDKKAKFSILIGGSNTTKIARCGDGICETGEKTGCCKDCGCDLGYSCADNICLKDECSENSECKSDSPCISARCKGEPKKCIFEPKNSCESSDNCCPDNCYYPDDLNCPETKIDPNQNFNDVQVNVPEQEEVVQQNPQEEKESFFKRAINWFLDIFR